MADETGNSSESKCPQLEPYQWKPGVSGNPSGRPKKKLVDSKLIELLSTMDGARALKIAETLIANAEAGDINAAKLVAERTEGKPIQKVEVTGEDGGPVSASLVVSFVEAK